MDALQWLVIDLLIILWTLLSVDRITKIPNVSTHKPTTIDHSLVSPDLAVNCTWHTEEDCLGSDHLPIMIELSENIKDDESNYEDKIPNFSWKHADLEVVQAFHLSSNINSTVNEDLSIYCWNFTKIILLAAEHTTPTIKGKKISEQSGNPRWVKVCKRAVSLKIRRNQQMVKE